MDNVDARRYAMLLSLASAEETKKRHATNAKGGKAMCGTLPYGNNPDFCRRRLKYEVCQRVDNSGKCPATTYFS